MIIETLTVTAVFSALAYFRPGKVEPLRNPLTIDRAGQFHAVLAPRINLAQPLLEDISLRLTEEERSLGDTQTHYLMVRDKEVRRHGADFYLLAASLRGGMLHFRVEAPAGDGRHLDTMRALSGGEPVAVSAAAEAALQNALRSAAEGRGAILAPIAA